MSRYLTALLATATAFAILGGGSPARPQHPAGLEAGARPGRAGDLPLLRLQAERGRQGDDVLREPGAVLLPDRRLPGQGGRDHPPARAATAAVLPLGRVPREPRRRPDRGGR